MTVSGTRPFDNAPGGWRGSMAELDASAAWFVAEVELGASAVATGEPGWRPGSICSTRRARGSAPRKVVVR